MDVVANCLRVKQVDSFQKLRLLLFLHQHPEGVTGAGQELARRLYLGDLSLIEKIISALQAANLIDCAGGHCTLADDPTTQLCLQNLAWRFEDPLARQTILDQVRGKTDE